MDDASSLRTIIHAGSGVRAATLDRSWARVALQAALGTRSILMPSPMHRSPDHAPLRGPAPALRLLACSLAAAALSCSGPFQPELPPAGVTLEREQITFGPKNHFFGYIGHVGTIPWNESGRYIVALRTDFVDRMPGPDDAADVIVLDTADGYAVRAVDTTRAWNVQQGTMLFWNPASPESQFFFNDRDPQTGKVFTALYDVAEGRRIREYRFPDTPVANGGMSLDGRRFAAINYARMARLRPVTGYPQAWDWTEGVSAPEDDGVFVVDSETGTKRLVVSFRQLADALRRERPEIDSMPLFINHTLWSRSGNTLFFFARANFRRPGRLNAAFTVAADGSGLRRLETHIGGHPEWDAGSLMIGSIARRQAVFDVDSQRMVGLIGEADLFPDPEGDIALSPDLDWLANGYKRDGEMHYVVHNRRSGTTYRAGGFDLYGRVSGDLRCDPAPRWNRTGDALLIPGMTEDGTRQMFLLRLPDQR